MNSAANHPAQHVPTFVPRLTETAKSQPFEMPNSVLSHTRGGNMSAFVDRALRSEILRAQLAARPLPGLAGWTTPRPTRPTPPRESRRDPHLPQPGNRPRPARPDPPQRPAPQTIW